MVFGGMVMSSANSRGTIKSVEHCIDTIFMWDIKVKGLDINGC